MKPRVIDLDIPVDVVKVGSASGLLWSSDRIRLAGWGERRVLEFGGLEDFDRALSEAQASAGENFYGFTSLPFDRHEKGRLIVPEFVLAEDLNGQIVMTGSEASDAEVKSSTAKLEAEANLAVSADAPEVTIDSGDIDDWKHKVTLATEQIDAGDLNKVVLARCVKVQASADVPIPQIVARLNESQPNSLLFVSDGFVGASPEMLVAKNGLSVSALPLAGTAKRLGDPVADSDARSLLISSTKDQWEHRLTIDWFLDTLLPFCSFVDADPEPSVIELANVFHLGTKVDGLLSSAETSIADLVAALHPTPAVGGDPQEVALQMISRLEGFDRGQYAGPTGWADQNGDGEFAVAIRSALVEDSDVQLFAGVGLVADSDPESELAETEAKLQAMVQALG